MCIDIVVRLKEFMKHVGLPSTQFADCAKIARPTISQLLNGRNRKVSNELISKLHDAFPELNILWLMFGDGEMINKTKPSNVPPSPSLFPPSPERRPADQGGYRNTTINDYQKSSSNIVRENKDEGMSAVREGSDDYEISEQTLSPNIQNHSVSNAEMGKRIKSIMVFYTDSSFEIFTPSDM